MNGERKRKTWLEVIERRKLEADAVDGIVSDEQVEEAVSRKKALIKEKNDLEQAEFDLWYETALKAKNSKFN